MKYILILYLCSTITGECRDPFVIEYEFNNHYDCILAGYRASFNTIRNLDREIVELEKQAVKFDCKGIPVFEEYEKNLIIPPKKPKIPV